MGSVIASRIVGHASSALLTHCHLSAPCANPDFQNTNSCSAHTRQTPACLEPKIRQTPIRTCIVKREGKMSGVSVYSNPTLGMTPRVQEPSNSPLFGTR